MDRKRWRPTSDWRRRRRTAAAAAIERQILVVKAANEGEIEGTFSTISRSGAGALLVGGN